MTLRTFTLTVTDEQHTALLVGLSCRIRECQENFSSDSYPDKNYWLHQIDKCKELDKLITDQWVEQVNVRR